MHPAMQGALVGLVVGLFLVVGEYVLVQKEVKGRAARLHREAVMDGNERKRIVAIVRFAFFVPPFFALLFWFIWG